MAVQKKRTMSPLMRQQRRWGLIFLSPWVFGFLAFGLIPIIASLIFSFTDFRLTSGEAIQFNNFENWRRLFTQDTVIKDAILNTLRFAAIALPLSIVMPLLLAALLNSKYLFGKSIFRTLFYMPYVVPIISAIYIWRGMLGTEAGWINRILAEIGIKGPNWLQDAAFIYPALNIIGLWTLGNAMLIMLAAMQGVPTELYEAAKVDGAGPIRRFFSITIPMISPVIFYNLILSVIGIFRYFEVPYILREDQSANQAATMFPNVYLYKEGFALNDMGYASVLAWVIFVLAMGATILIFMSARFWVYYGAEERD
ncbi:MAG: sugar ABC transporter permease [Phototrophicales bacterium]|nr:MAG: sugar ABC transporter permease [Phototrophicales bacterium]RMG77046.1 MAG: sugar ABC transporter permease [Chloroflexota bacterium]